MSKTEHVWSANSVIHPLVNSRTWLLNVVVLVVRLCCVWASSRIKPLSWEDFSWCHSLRLATTVIAQFNRGQSIFGIHEKYFRHRQVEKEVATKLITFSDCFSTSAPDRAFKLRLPYSLSGVFSDQPLTLLIRVGYPQTYISMESL